MSQLTMKTSAENTPNVQFDNIATPSHPVWRKRWRKPFTCRAIRMELARQAALQPVAERMRYLSRRLTALDKALDDGQVQALEAWLDAEEILAGRAKITNYEGGSGGGGKPSPVPDDWLRMLCEHAARRRHLSLDQRRALHILLFMMGDREWDYAAGGCILLGGNLGYAKAKRAFISAVQSAAATLEKTAQCKK
jgi:hypothetical protein